MHIRQGAPPLPTQRKFRSRFPLAFLAAIFACACPIALILSGCAAPGEPTERRPPIPQPVADLAAQQDGDSVALTFTIPTETVDHKALDQSPAIEIYRDFEPPSSDATPPGPAQPSKSAVPAPTMPLVTIPPAIVDTYVSQGHFSYLDSLKPSDFSQHPNTLAVYAVRTRASQKKESPLSNVVSLRVYPLPDPISDLKAEVTHSGIQLAWTPPTETPVGPAPPVSSYRIYRTESQPAAIAQSPSAQAAKSSQPGSEAALKELAVSQSPAYLDTQIQFGSTYTYSVRSIVNLEGHELESADSNRLTILALDTFPPAAPQGLLVVFVPAQATEPAHLELSWSISPETDLAGYNVYRSEHVGVQGTRLNSELLLTPSFQDMNAVPGRTYFYRVTAVDHSGNESPASVAISSAVPAESQSTP